LQPRHRAVADEQKRYSAAEIASLMKIQHYQAEGGAVSIAAIKA